MTAIWGYWIFDDINECLETNCFWAKWEKVVGVSFKIWE